MQEFVNYDFAKLQYVKIRYFWISKMRFLHSRTVAYMLSRRCTHGKLHLTVMLVLVLKDQNAVLVLVLDDAVLVLAAEVLVLEQKSLVMSLCSVLLKSQFTETACAWCKLACYLFIY